MCLHFKGEFRQFFHYVLISMFSDGTGSPVPARIVHFAQKRTNNLKLTDWTVCSNLNG